MPQKRTVYVIRSQAAPAQEYIGLTSDIVRRLAAHNAGRSPHTSKHVPWREVVTLVFSDEDRAASFERYLKSGSGSAFCSRHFR